MVSKKGTGSYEINIPVIGIIGALAYIVPLLFVLMGLSSTHALSVGKPSDMFIPIIFLITVVGIFAYGFIRGVRGIVGLTIISNGLLLLLALKVIIEQLQVSIPYRDLDLINGTVMASVLFIGYIVLALYCLKHEHYKVYRGETFKDLDDNQRLF